MKTLLLTGIAPLALALASTPAVAQSHQEMPGMQMPGMTMPAAKPAPARKAKPKRRATAPSHKHRGARHPTVPTNRALSITMGPVRNTPPPGEGSQMPGMTMPGAQTGAQTEQPAAHGGTAGAMPGMAMPASNGQDHGVHDMATMPGMASEKRGTDLAPGDASAPPVQTGRPADHYYDPEAMAAAESALLGSHGGMVFHRFLADLAEYQVRDGRDGYRWDGELWIGGDLSRLVLKSEGEGNFGGRIEKAEAQALYSRALDPYWNLQFGLRQDFAPTPARTYAVVGIEGLAPYWIDIDGALFLSDKGDVLGRVTASYDQRITPKLILQPRGEFNFSLQDMPRERIGSGVSNFELGLRLRYEARREFAPYVGISWERRLGNTADLARMAGEDTGGVSFVAGMRAWF